MTTTVGPALGQGAVMNQATSYDAISARRFWSVGRQEGVISAGSYEVVQRAAGVGMFVDIAATTGDGALVQGDAVTGQGLYFVAPHSALITEAITAAHATLPRVDQIVLEILDTQHDATGSSLARVRVVDGTATAGATLDNRNGAAALPNSALLLADVHVPATDTTISNSQIRDRRKWACGAFVQITGSGSADHTVASGTPAEITAYTVRLECSGAPLEIEFVAKCWNTSAGGGAQVFIQQDGVTLKSVTVNSPAVSESDMSVFQARTTPSAGSHVFRIMLAAPGGVGTATIGNTAAGDTAGVPTFVSQEIVRQNVKNNATTTG